MANVLISIDKKFKELLPKELANKAVYRVNGFDRSYPLTHCAKRNVGDIVDKELGSCVKPVIVDGYICLIDAYDYVKIEDNVKYTLIDSKTPINKITSKIKKKITRN